MLTTLFVWQTHYSETLSNEALYFEKIQTKKSGEKIDSFILNYIESIWLHLNQLKVYLRNYEDLYN